MARHVPHTEVLRRFNRSFTARIGVLDDRFLGGDRPVGHARMLFEIGAEGPDGASVRDLRARLALDSGYVSRVLRSLEGDGLVTVSPDPDDGRQRRAVLTADGWEEWRRLDARSDELADRVLGGLGPRQRERLAAALAEADRLLAAAAASFDVVDPHDEDALAAMRAYVAELDDRFPGGFDPGGDWGLDGLAPPHGVFVVVRLDGRVVGCGGVQTIGAGVGEVKRMWVDPATRGMGLGPRLLAALEDHGRRLGHRVMRLDTNATLVEAIAMYRRAGYVEIERYNDNPYPDLFFEKSLIPGGSAP
ncbi:GNAT family N-acetyltransferase [Euzebya sp.]|uniref:bifunctional helix-turn-helix transcriptional regulator/GNAT family N-acetyltransferase n=1 Tax=Euzebya sp. TaxID=1971409 RepID=UPI0035125171